MVSKRPRLGRKRIQVVVTTGEERELRDAAARDGKSNDLSGWLREVGLERAREGGILIPGSVATVLREQARMRGLMPVELAAIAASREIGEGLVHYTISELQARIEEARAEINRVLGDDSHFGVEWASDLNPQGREPEVVLVEGNARQRASLTQAPSMAAGWLRRWFIAAAETAAPHAISRPQTTAGAVIADPAVATALECVALAYVGGGPVSIPAEMLHRVGDDEALAAVDEVIGTPADWGSALVRYRMGSEWQRDWLIEVGHWIVTAKRLGFADDIRERLNGSRAELILEKTANDNAHRKLNTELAEAMAAHYLMGMGWRFSRRNVQAPGEDIDLEMITRTGAAVALQIKAPDVVGDQQFRSSIGGNDEHIRLALDKAASQLPRPARQPAIVVLSAQSSIQLSGATYVIEETLYGTTRQHAEIPGVRLRRSDLGKFATDWQHVGAVMALDYRRGEPPDYCCTVLLNPWAAPAARCERAWFPRSRTLWLDGDVIRWDRGQPMGSVPDGTILVD